MQQINPHSTYALWVFVHHGNTWKELGTILWAELLKGNITPQMYGLIYEQSNGKKVFVSKVGKAVPVSVQTGTRTDALIEIVSGLKAGDTVITTGIMSLKPDAAVKIISIKK